MLLPGMVDSHSREGSASAGDGSSPLHPGSVDAHSVVGLAGALNGSVGQVRDQDQLDASVPISSSCAPSDAYDATGRLVEWVASTASRRPTRGMAPAPTSAARR